MKKYSAIIATTILSLSLIGCGSNTKKALGLERAKPDEFAVYKRAPLTVPPDFNLSPPEPGAPRPQEQQTSDQAKAILTSPSPAQDAISDASSAEQGLLFDIKSTNAQSNIRKVLDSEYGIEDESNSNEKSAIDKILGRDGDGVEGTPVDPIEESKQLKEKGITAPQPQIQIPIE